MNDILVYFQCGHNAVWNFEMYNDDKIVDGFILGPKMREGKDKIIELSDEIGEISLFDPQFYQPKSNLEKTVKI